MSQVNDNGTNRTFSSDPFDDLDSRWVTYKQVGTIQLLRGNKFIISLDEHKLPEGTRALYVKE